MAKNVKHCTLCSGLVSHNNAVWCASCALPHHKLCWLEEGQCAALGCTEVRYLEIEPAGSAAGLKRVDLDTPLERGLFSAALGLGIATVLILLVDARSEDVLTCFILAIFSGWLYSNTDCTYFLDTRRKKVIYLRDIAGFRRRWDVCSFDHIALVAVSGCKTRSFGTSDAEGKGWAYWVSLVLDDCTTLPVTDPIPFDVKAANLRGQLIARALHVPLFEGKARQSREAASSANQITMKTSANTLSLHCCVSRIITTVTVIAVILLVYFVADSRRPENLLKHLNWTIEREHSSLTMESDSNAIAWDFRYTFDKKLSPERLTATPKLWALQGVFCYLIATPLGREANPVDRSIIFLVPNSDKMTHQLQQLLANPSMTKVGRTFRIKGHDARPRPLGTSIPQRFAAWTLETGERLPSSFVVVDLLEVYQ